MGTHTNHFLLESELPLNCDLVSKSIAKATLVLEKSITDILMHDLNENQYSSS